MQSITLIVLGKLNASYFREAAAEYQKRLSAFCKLNIVELPEETIREKNVSQSTIQKTLEKEAQEILRHVVRPGVLVAMCIEGKQLSSEELSVFLEQRAISGEGIFNEQNDLSASIGTSYAVRTDLSGVLHTKRKQIS